jgi:hypothetical protein
MYSKHVFSVYKNLHSKIKGPHFLAATGTDEGAAAGMGWKDGQAAKRKRTSSSA